MPLWAPLWPEAWRAGPRPPPCSNTKCYYIIDGQFLILFFMIICFYADVRKNEIKIFQKKIIYIKRNLLPFILFLLQHRAKLLTGGEKKKDERERERERKERFEQSASEWRRRFTPITPSPLWCLPSRGCLWASQCDPSELKVWNQEGPPSS